MPARNFGSRTISVTDSSRLNTAVKWASRYLSSRVAADSRLEERPAQSLGETLLPGRGDIGAGGVGEATVAGQRQRPDVVEQLGLFGEVAAVEAGLDGGGLLAQHLAE